MNGGEEHAEKTGEEAKVAGAGGRGGSSGGGGGDSLGQLADTFAHGGDFFGQLGRLVPASQGLTPDQLKFIAKYQATAAKLDGPIDGYERDEEEGFPKPAFTFEPTEGHHGGTITVRLIGCRKRERESLTKLSFYSDNSEVELTPAGTEEGVYLATVPPGARTGLLTLIRPLVRGKPVDKLPSAEKFILRTQGL